MKKVKTKKKQGMIETETRPVDKVDGPGKEGEVSIVTKSKDKGNLKKPGLKEEPEEGLAAKWVGKDPMDRSGQRFLARGSD